MAVSKHFHLILLASITVFISDAYLRKYVPLIAGINEHYGPSSICLVMPFSSQRGNDRTLTFAMTREFSRKGISSLVINSEETLKRVKKYNERVRPIVVVVMTAVEDMKRFASIKDKYDISHSIWFVIFENEFGASICDFCYKPTKNILGLRFDTEMLVVCCKNKTIQEWWSDHRNRTETASIGEWTVKEGLTSITNQSLYVRRSDVAGAGFRVGFATISGFYYEENGGEPAGFCNDILMELARVMNFTVTKILKREIFGFWEPNNQSWTGVIELINNDLIELGVGEFLMSVDRLKAVDFTLPVIASSKALYFRAVDNAVASWNAHFKVFDLEIWIVINLLVIASPIIVALMHTRTRDDSFRNLVAEHYLNVWGIFCQQGLAAFPKKTPLRIAYCSIYIAAMVIVAAYSAALISFLTVSTASAPFTSLSDFANDGTYALSVLKNSPAWYFLLLSKDPLLIKMKTLMKPLHTLPSTMEEAFDEVCKRKVAFFSRGMMATSGTRHFPCKIAQIDLGTTHFHSFVLRKGSEYTGIINYHLQRFHDHGIIDRLNKKYMTLPTRPETEPFEVTLSHVASVWLVLAGGIGFSLLVMLGEKNWALFRRKLSNSKSKTIHSQKTNIHRAFIRKNKHATSHSQLFIKRRTGRSNIPAIEFCP